MFISLGHASVRAHSPPPIIIACIGRTFYSFRYADLQKYLFCSVRAMAFIINGCDCERWFVFGCRAVPFFVGFGFSVSQIVFILLYVDRQLQRGTFWSSHGPICNLLQLKWAHLLKCWHFFVHTEWERMYRWNFIIAAVIITITNHSDMWQHIYCIN